MLSKEDINNLIEKTDMVKLVEPYTKLKKTGSGYVGLCPFHEEKTPSFSVSQDKHLAYCFSCHKGGSPIQFLMDIKHIDFMDAVKELAKINNVNLNLSTKSDNSLTYKKYYDMNELALKFYQANLFNTKDGKVALKYLHERGLNDDVINDFKIGLAPKEDNKLYSLLKDAGYLELDMIDNGLVKSNSNSYQDVFIDRIMFPILDEVGNVVAFSGRTYKEFKMAKYMNTTDTFIFKKSNVLYNLNQAMSSIEQNKRVILYEGYMDVIASYRAGLKEAICSMGTELTTNQIKKIKKYTNNVIIAYDNDKAGLNATFRAINMLRKEHMNILVMRLNGAKDSDEFLKLNGPVKYKGYFNSNLKEAIDFIYDTYTNNANLNSSTQVEELKKDIYRELRTFNSALLVEKYLKKLGNLLNISYEALLNDYNRTTPYKPIEEIKIVEKTKLEEKTIYELRLFEYAKISKEKALYIDNYLEKNDCLLAFCELNQRLWVLLVNEYYSHHQEFLEDEFVKLLNENNLFDDYYQNTLQLENTNIKYTDEDLDSCLKRMIQKANEKKQDLLQENIQKATSAELQKELVLKKFKERKNKKGK